MKDVQFYCLVILFLIKLIWSVNSSFYAKVQKSNLLTPNSNSLIKIFHVKDQKLHLKNQNLKLKSKNLKSELKNSKEKIENLNRGVNNLKSL